MKLVLLIALLAPACAAALRSGCSADDPELAQIRDDEAVKVEQGLAGGAATCYKVTLARDGQSIQGYVLGEDLPAISEFVRERQKTAEASFEAQAREARAREAAAAKEAAAKAAAAKAAGDKSEPAAGALDPGIPPVFADFSARDTKGKAVSLAGLGGRVVLVTFWSPRSAASRGELMSLQSVYNQFRGRGLRAVGISTDPNTQHMNDALDDVTLGFPQVPDRSGLAQRYAVDPKGGTTFLLDDSHLIVAAGLKGAKLQEKIRELLSQQ
jgi:peroxiredoxin